MRNKRAKAILKKFSLPYTDFVVIDKGKVPGEQALVLAENGKYAGYGYMDTSIQINSPEELKQLIRPAPYFPDADMLVRGWIKKGNGKVIQTKISSEEKDLFF